MQGVSGGVKFHYFVLHILNICYIFAPEIRFNTTPVVFVNDERLR